MKKESQTRPLLGAIVANIHLFSPTRISIPYLSLLDSVHSHFRSEMVNSFRQRCLLSWKDCLWYPKIQAYLGPHLILRVQNLRCGMTLRQYQEEGNLAQTKPYLFQIWIFLLYDRVRSNWHALPKLCHFTARDHFCSNFFYYEHLEFIQ